MGFPNCDWVKKFLIGKTVQNIYVNKKFPTEMMDIIFTDGTRVSLIACEKKNMFSHNAKLIVTPKDSKSNVIQLKTIMENKDYL